MSLPNCILCVIQFSLADDCSLNLANGLIWEIVMRGQICVLQIQNVDPSASTIPAQPLLQSQ